MKFPWSKATALRPPGKPVLPPPPVPVAEDKLPTVEDVQAVWPKKKTRKPRKAQQIFGRVCFDNTWFEQRNDGIYVRRRWGRKWEHVSFSTIRDYAIGQFNLPVVAEPVKKTEAADLAPAQ